MTEPFLKISSPIPDFGVLAIKGIYYQDTQHKYAKYMEKEGFLPNTFDKSFESSRLRWYASYLLPK